MQELFLLPARDLAETLDGLVLHMLELERLMRPLDPDLGGAGKVALLNEHFHKLRLIELGGDYNILPLLYIRADLDDKLGIAFKLFRVHI